MTINCRVISFGLAGASALALAVGGASAAQAEPSRVISQVSFTVSNAVPYISHPIAVTVAEPGLPASAFDAQIWCEDGNSYSVSVHIVSGTTSYADSFFQIPAIESGKTCSYAMGVTSDFHTGVVFDKIGISPEPGGVFITGTVTNGRPRPTY